MSISTSPLVLSAVILLSSYFLWTKVLVWSARSKAGCSTPVKYRHLDPFYGLDLFIRKIRKTQAGNLPTLDDEISAKYGKTVHTLFFGTNHWMTMDPRVSQVVDATEADKFKNESTTANLVGHC
jgi:hypothetical protein